MIKTYDDDSNKLCDFYEEGESFEGLFDFCQGYCDNCNDHPKCMYRENINFKEKLKIAREYFKKIIISDTRKGSLDLTPTYLAERALEQLND